MEEENNKYNSYSNGRNMEHHIDVYHKKDIIVRDESKTLTGKGTEFKKEDPNRILHILPYVVILLPITLIIIWTILELTGFIKKG